MVIITRTSLPSDDGATTDENAAHHSTIMNGLPLHTCYLCWRHAEHEYHTTPCFLSGVFYPSETRHLCKMHYKLIWEVLLESLYARVQVNEQYEHDEMGGAA